MRWMLLLGLFVGCARTVPTYSGITNAQVKWRQAMWECEGKTDDHCMNVRGQYALEDAQERQERTALAQAEENQAARDRRRGVASGMATAYQGPVAQPQPIFQPSVNCTSTRYGNQTQTHCR